MVIDAISPNAGPRTGGFVVRIEGSGFGASPFVTLGANEVESLVLVTDEAIELVAPADRVGPASLTVVNESGGRATVVDAFFFHPLDPIAWDGRWFADAPDEASANLVVVTSSETLSQLDLALPRAATGAIAGVLTSGGAPLAGHRVIASRGSERLSAYSGVDGAYRIAGLRTGAWIVTTGESLESALVDEAWPDTPDPSLAATVDVDGNTVSGIDFELVAGGTIIGTVSGGTSALAGVTVYAVPESPNALQFAYASTDELGSYVLSGLAPGTYRLVAFAFGTGFANEYYGDALDPDDATPVVSASDVVTADFELDAAGSLSGSITELSATPGPLPFVLVIAHDVDRDLDYTSATGVDGTYVVSGLPPGNYTVRAPEIGQWFPAATTSTDAQTVVVVAGQDTDAISFLGRIGDAPCDDPAGAGTVAGEVRGSLGETILRAQAQLIPVSGGDLAIAVSGLDGAWEASCVEPGEYALRIVAPSTNLVRFDWPSTLVVTSGGSMAGFDVELQRGARLEGRVRDAESGAAIGGAPVRVRHVPTGASRLSVTGFDGRWSADRTSQGGLAPGEWRVEGLPAVQLDAEP